MCALGRSTISESSKPKRMRKRCGSSALELMGGNTATTEMTFSARAQFKLCQLMTSFVYSEVSCINKPIGGIGCTTRFSAQ